MHWLIGSGHAAPIGLLDRLSTILVAALLIGAVLIAGWLLGLLARVVFTAVFSRRLDQFSRWLGYKQLEQSLRLHFSLATLVGYAVQFVVTGLALLLLDAIYYPATAQAIVQAGIGYVPTLAVAMTIVLLSLFLSQILADVTFTAARAAKRSDAALLSMAARVGIVAVGLVAALLELGVATIFLTAVLVALLSTGTLAVGIASGVGGAGFVRDLLAGRAIRSQLKPGQRIQVDHITGIIIECGPSATLIATDDGKRCLVPNTLIAQKSVTLG